MAHGSAEPFRIGYLDEGMYGSREVFNNGIGGVMQLRFDEGLHKGQIDRPIELVLAHSKGLPSGSAHSVQQAWLELRDAGVLAIIGPAITDNAIAVKPLFEEHKIATLNWPGTEKTRGEYGFHYQVGVLYEDGPLIARALAARGLSDVAVIRDRGAHGAEYFEHFAMACEDLDLTIISDQQTSPIAEDFTQEAAKAQSSGAQALVYLGFGGVLVHLSRAVKELGWQAPCFTCSAGMHWYGKNAEERAFLEGWVYVDMVDEDNPVMQHLLAAYSKQGRSVFSPSMGAGYDMATLVVLGLRHATVFTPEGFKEGLEKIHQIPTALGSKGTVMGFGPWERTALKGSQYLVLRVMGIEKTTKYIW